MSPGAVGRSGLRGKAAPSEGMSPWDPLARQDRSTRRESQLRQLD